MFKLADKAVQIIGVHCGKFGAYQPSSRSTRSQRKKKKGLFNSEIAYDA
jgi:hypothetical protein